MCNILHLPGSIPHCSGGRIVTTHCRNLTRFNLLFRLGENEHEWKEDKVHIKTKKWIERKEKMNTKLFLDKPI